jgi:hypothetical protein
MVHELACQPLSEVCSSNLLVLDLRNCNEAMMQRDPGGQSSATFKRTFPGLGARAGLAEFASPFTGNATSLKKSFEKKY